MLPGTRTRGGEYMGRYFEMMRYYHQYQEAAIKLDQKRRNLERLDSSLKSASDPDEARIFKNKFLLPEMNMTRLKRKQKICGIFPIPGSPNQK